MPNLITVDGMWGTWGNWSDCSKPCGGGVQNRTRLCNNPFPQHDGPNCTSKDTLLEQFPNGTHTQKLSDEQTCNTNHCPSKWRYELY